MGIFIVGFFACGVYTIEVRRLNEVFVASTAPR